MRLLQDVNDNLLASLVVISIFVVTSVISVVGLP